MPNHFDPVRVALVGCGNVSRQYLATIIGDPRVRVVCCADLDPSRANAIATEYAIPRTATLETILEDREIELVLNLTAPVAHANVSLQALGAGKHVYSEKTLAVTVTDAEHIVDLARERELWVGCAPDTFLGTGIQATKKLLDSGQIGRPFMANMVKVGLGPERFHPGPEFLFQRGAGPLFDNGPYLINTLSYLLGPIHAVTAVLSRPMPERTLIIGDRAGAVIDSAVPTSLVATLEFQNGVIGTLSQSWDVTATHAPPLEIHGTKGSILGTPPNSWSGVPALKLLGEDGDFVEQAVDFDIDGEVPQGMGVGVLQMCEAIRAQATPQASARRALHTLKVLLAIEKSGDTESRIVIEDDTRAKGAADALPDLLEQ